MKTLSPQWKAALAQNATYLCRLWTIERKDGVLFRFTDHDRNLTVAGNVYTSVDNYQASAVQTAINSAASDIDIKVLLSPEGIEYMQLQRGLFDEAPTELFLYDWFNKLDPISIHTGRVHSIAGRNTQTATLKLTGPLGRVDTDFTERYSAKCRATFGDARCKYPIETVTDPFAVTVLGANALSFTASALAGQAIDLWKLGTILWTTGPNKGTRQEVAGNNELGRINLLFPPPFAIELGNAGTITQGCPKTVAACTAYENLINYRGEPKVPGDKGIGS